MQEAYIEIQVAALPVEVELLSDVTSDSILVAGGVGAGKSRALASKHLQLCMRNGDLPSIAGAPDGGYLADVTIPHFRDLLTAYGVWDRCSWFKRRNDLVVRGLGPEFTIWFRSCEQSLAGRNVAHFTLDEAELVQEYDARTLMERTRVQCKLPQKIFGCAPEGIGSWCHRWFETDPRPRSRLIRASTRDNVFLPPDYIETTLSHLKGAERDRYIEGQFVASTGRVYDRYETGVHDSIPAVYDVRQATEYVMGCDFGAGCSFFALGVIIGDVVCWVGEVIKEDTDTFEMSAASMEAWRQLFTSWGRPTDSRGASSQVDAVIDPAGGRSMKTSVSDAAVLERDGFRVLGHKRHPNVRDRILAVNRKFHTDTMFVDAKACPSLHRSLLYQAYDRHGRPEKGKHHEKSRGLDHGADAIGYAAEYLWPIPGFEPYVTAYH